MISEEEQQTIQDTEKCFNCKNGSIIRTNDHYVCANCGAVLEKTFFDPTEEFYTDRKFKENLVDNELGSEVNIKRDYSRINATHKSLFMRIRGINAAAKRNCETLSRNIRFIYRFCGMNDLSPEIRNRIVFLFKTIYKASKEEKINKITNHTTLVVFCILVAVREYNQPLSFKEIISFTKSQGRRFETSNLTTLALEYREKLRITIEGSTYRNYLPKILTDICTLECLLENLTLNNITVSEYQQSIEKMIHRLYKMIAKKKGGVNPQILTASLIFAADQILYCRKNKQLKFIGHVRQFLTQKELSTVVIGCEYSIREQMRNLLRPAINQLQEELYG